MRRLGRELAVYIADSTSWASIPNNYLLGRVLSVIRGKVRSLINEEKVRKLE